MDRKLKAFLEIAEQRNLTHAAEALGVAQPALSKTLQSIEIEVGATLFDRLPRGLSLTAAGHEYLHHCRRIEQEYAAALEAVSATVDGHKGAFHVGAGILFHLKTVPSIFQSLGQEFVATTLHLKPGVHTELIPRLLNEELDIVMGRMAWDKELPSLEAIPLLDAEIGVVARRDHPITLEPTPLSSPALLGEFDWVSYQEATVSSRYFQDYFVWNNQPVPRIAVVSESFMAGLELVASGEYLMTGPLQLSETYRQLGLEIMQTKQPFSKFKAGIWVRRSSLQFPVVARFIELACKRYGVKCD